MTDMAAENSLQLDELLGDLRLVAEKILNHEAHNGEPLPFEKAESELAGQLSLHLLDYISFLEAQDTIEYDRSSDELYSTDGIEAVLDVPSEWREAVTFEFDKELADGDGVDSGSPGPPPIGGEDDADDFDFDDDFVADDDSIAVEVSDEPSQVTFEDEDSAEPLTPDDDSVVELDVDEVEEVDEIEPIEETADADSAVRVEDQPESDGQSRSARPRQSKESSSTSHKPDTTSTTANSMNDRTRSSRRTSRSSKRSRDRYEREEEIGTGGLGTVYRGRHTELERDVAIKEISNVFDVFADIQREDIVSRFRNIVQTQSQISHPAIIQIYDLDTDAEYPYVVTEYAPNGCLRRLIDNEERRSLSIALKYFIQILHGLHAAHESDIVHGSVKPENVVLDASGNAKLCDFGLSTLVDLSGASNQVYVGVGAVAYMAPEQFQDPNAATVQSDIYSLGIMFYELLTGKVPGRRSPMPSSFYPEIPRKLDDIFDRMSMDASEDRYPSIEAVLTDFYGADECIQLLDRQSGVVFLRDPIEYGDEPLVDEDGNPISPPEERVMTAEHDAPSPEEFEEAEDMGGDQTEIQDGPEASDSEEETEEADGGDDESEAEASDEDTEEASEENESEEDEAEEQDADEEGGEGEDDEVLDKLDEYGEMFEE